MKEKRPQKVLRDRGKKKKTSVVLLPLIGKTRSGGEGVQGLGRKKVSKEKFGERWPQADSNHPSRWIRGEGSSSSKRN